MAAKIQSKSDSEETCQYEIGLDTLQQKRDVLWTHLQDQAFEQGRQLQGEGEQSSLVKVTMETEEIDTEMDMTVIKQGILPEAPAQSLEVTIYECLVTFEPNDIQWQFEALSYLVSILETNKKARSSGDET